MQDNVQAYLLAWQSDGQRSTAARVVTLIGDEWRPIVRLFLRHADSDEVENGLADAIEALVLTPTASGGCRALAPADAQSPRAWRRRVLRNHLVSVNRKRFRRSHAEEAEIAGMAPIAEKAAWRKLCNGLASGQAPAEVRAVGGDNSHFAEHATPESLSMDVERRSVIRESARLAVRRAVILLLALRADPSHFAETLAAEIGDQVEHVLHRMYIARTTELDGVHEYLSMAMVRVCWPNEPSQAKALDAARKALQRAMGDVQQLLLVTP